MAEIAVITGATSGIGRESAIKLGQSGFNLILTGRRRERLEDLKAFLAEAGITIRTIAGDICDIETRDAIVEAADDLGGCDVLVNNVGFGQTGPFEAVDEDAARRQFDVNLFAPMALTRVLLPGMRERGKGRIINVSSIAGRAVLPMFGWYSATKFAMEALSDAIRMETASMGISVSLIEPGPVRTEFGAASDEAYEGLTVPEDYKLSMERFFSRYKENEKLGVSPEVVAWRIYHAATSPRPRLVYKVTFLARFAAITSWLFPRSIAQYFMRKAFRQP